MTPAQLSRFDGGLKEENTLSIMQLKRFQKQKRLEKGEKSISGTKKSSIKPKEKSKFMAKYQ